MYLILKLIRIRLDIYLLMFLSSSTVYAENLFQEDKYQALIADEKALKVGDLVTLIIVESARATTSKDEKSGRNVNVSANAGKSLSVINPNNRDGRSEGVSTELELGSEKASNNKRSGAFNAQITVTVTEVKDSDKLYVIGEQKINVNGDEQIIRARGWLRTRDIDQNNTALSVRLSDAKIEYSGDQESKNGFIRTTWGYIKKLW